MLLLAFSVFIPNTSRAVVSAYKMNVSSGSPTSMSGATTIWSGYPGSRNYNVAYGVYNIGFNFTFDGTVYSQFRPYISGMITLGSGVQSNNYNNTINSTTVPVIAPFWDGLYQTGGAGCYTPTVKYLVSGTAPSRVLTVEWYKVEVAPYYAGYSTFLLRLYEAGGRIEFVYPSMTTTPDCGWCNGCTGFTTSASIGLANGTNQFICATPNGSTATSSTSSANNSVNIWNTKINTNVMYVFTQLPNVQLSATPKSFNVGSVPTGSFVDMDVTVTHAGTEGKLKVNTATIVGDPDYSVITNPLPDSLAVGQSATIKVRFAPQAPGARAATLTLTSNGLDSGTQQVTFTGIGLAPFIGIDTNILFKKSFTKLGQSKSGRIIIRSTSVPTLLINSITITGIDADQYAISRYPASAIPGGDSDSVFVTYTPTREGRRAATMNIFSNAVNFPVEQVQLIGTGILPHIIVTPVPMTFDSTAIGDSVCKTLSIYNPGSDTLRILSNMLSSSEGDFEYYTLKGADTAIPPDKTRLINICFKPKQAGTREGKVILTTNIIKTFESVRRDTAGTFAIPLQGSAVAYGGLALSADGKNVLDSAIVGTEVCRPDTIRNIGEAEVIITAITLSGNNASEFTTSGVTLPYRLKPGSFVVLNVCTTPALSGLRVATLTLGGTTSGHNIGISSTLTTLGLNACLQPSPTALFNGVQIYRGSDSVLCDTVTNCGDIDAIYTATITGADAADYTVTPTTSQLVAAGGTAVFCVQYHPLTTHTSSATMTISAPNTAAQTVALGGTACCALLTNDQFTIPPTNAGGHGTFTVTINNSGCFDWDAGMPFIQGDTDAFHIGAVGTIPGNGNKQVTINYDPTLTNHTYAAKLSFPNGGPCQEDTLAMTLTQQTGSASVAIETAKDGFAISQNRPNPFSLTSSFVYTVPVESAITLTLNDMTGKVVRTLTTGRISAGEHTVMIDANQLSSGTYVLALQSGSVRLTREIVIAK